MECANVHRLISMVLLSRFRLSLHLCSTVWTNRGHWSSIFANKLFFAPPFPEQDKKIPTENVYFHLVTEISNKNCTMEDFRGGNIDMFDFGSNENANKNFFFFLPKTTSNPPYGCASFPTNRSLTVCCLHLHARFTQALFIAGFTETEFKTA